MFDAAEDRILSPDMFLHYVSTDDALREASLAGEKAIQEFELKALAREDIYNVLLDVEENSKNASLNDEERRLLERMIRDRTRHGLALEKDKRDKLLDIKTRIMGLEVDFQNTCNSEKGFILFTREELDGVPEASIEGYPQEGDKFRVTFKVGVVVCTYPDTRYRPGHGVRERARDAPARADGLRGADDRERAAAGGDCEAPARGGRHPRL